MESLKKEEIANRAKSQQVDVTDYWTQSSNSLQIVTNKSILRVASCKSGRPELKKKPNQKPDQKPYSSDKIL